MIDFLWASFKHASQTGSPEFCPQIALGPRKGAPEVWSSWFWFRKVRSGCWGYLGLKAFGRSELGVGRENWRRWGSDPSKRHPFTFSGHPFRRQHKTLKTGVDICFVLGVLFQRQAFWIWQVPEACNRPPKPQTKLRACGTFVLGAPAWEYRIPFSSAPITRGEQPVCNSPSTYRQKHRALSPKSPNSGCVRAKVSSGNRPLTCSLWKRMF